tara:strand:+ start:836 stop:1120 length:285 start_codon:yes stop_codon:yes gene_type:complete
MSAHEVSQAAKYLYGYSCNQIDYHQFTEIITRMYGNEDGHGGMFMSGRDMQSNINLILGKHGAETVYSIQNGESVGGKLKWIYNLEKNDGFIVE